MQAWADRTLLVFDGAVLELFGFSGAGSLRFHVANLDLEVAEPDRKGRRFVTIKHASWGAGGCAFDVTPEDWPAVEPLLDAVFAAMG